MELRECPYCGELPEVTKHFKEELFCMVHRCKIFGPISIDFTNMNNLQKRWNTRHNKELARPKVIYCDELEEARELLGLAQSFLGPDIAEQNTWKKIETYLNRTEDK